MLDAVHESDRFGLQCCRHEPRRRAALGCNRRRGSRTPPEVQECENRGWTLWTATCRIKQAGRISGSPLEWKPVGRSDEGTPVRRQVRRNASGVAARGSVGSTQQGGGAPRALDSCVSPPEQLSQLFVPLGEGGRARGPQRDGGHFAESFPIQH